MSTGYTYTGQYSNTADFGLMYYNARWYDPLGRFAQADTIVPAGVQGYDRYAYVNNNPVRYTDPSGHYACGDGEAHDCDGNGQDPNADPYESPEVDLEESFGLDNNSDFACTVYSCTVATPSVCPVGQTCWTVPDYWDLNPRHADYYSHVVNVYFISLVFSKDRYSQRYFSIGGAFNVKSLSPIGYSFVIGSIGSAFDNKITNVNDMKTFMTGLSFNLTGGALAGGGTTLTPGVLLENGYSSDLKPSSMETGLYLIPSLGITASWGYSHDP